MKNKKIKIELTPDEFEQVLTAMCNRSERLTTKIICAGLGKGWQLEYVDSWEKILKPTNSVLTKLQKIKGL